MKRKNRLVCMLLVLCLVVAMAPFSAAAEETASQNTSTDFILVMDCSGTMTKNDPMGLAVSACKLFVDMIPVQNARVSVVTIGNTDSADRKGYAYSADFEVEYNRNMIHQIVPLSEIKTLTEKNTVKQAVAKAGKEEGKQTPIAHGLAAAVDILTQNGATNENACVILLSDGAMTSANWDESEELISQSLLTAKNNQWPMFCIELDYHNQNREDGYGDGFRAHELLNRICDDSGTGRDARIKISSPEEINAAFAKIFSTFMNIDIDFTDTTVISDEEGIAEKEFIIPPLTSEASVIIQRGNVDKIELYYDGSEEPTYVIKGACDEDNLKVTVEPGNYHCVKLICPKEGNWKVRTYGDPYANIDIVKMDIQELAMKMLAEPSRDGVLYRDDTISVEAFFTYMDKEYPANDFYKEHAATLVVRGIDENSREYTFSMTGTENSYTCEFDVGEAPTGEFEMWVRVEDEIFRNGTKESNKAQFESQNQGIAPIPAGTTVRESFVNADVEAIDLSEIFSNPDGDTIEYNLVCDDAKFEYEIAEERYLTIKSGYVPGTYDLVLSAKDADMSESVTHAIKLTVVDQPLYLEKEIELPYRLYTDRYSFQEDHSEYTLNLDDCFEDPDGVTLEYSVTIADPRVAEIVQNGNLVTLKAVEVGETVLTVIANDKVSEVTAEVEIESVSGKAEFWAKNWIWFALAGGLIVLIIIIIIFISKNTKVKGTWNITFEENGNTAVAESVSIGILSVGRRKTFKLKELVDEVGLFMDDPTGVVANVSNYFMDQNALAIELKGVPVGSGFVVQKIPSSDQVVVEYMGRPVTKKVRVTSGGYITFKLRAPGSFGIEDELNITIS